MEERKLYIEMIEECKEKGAIKEIYLEDNYHYNRIMSGRTSFDLALDEPETRFENNTILKITRLENKWKDDEADSFYAQIKNLIHYDSFDELYTAATFGDSDGITMYKCGFEKNISRKTFLSIMNERYPHTKQEQFGVLAIQLELIGAPFVDRSIIWAVCKAEERRHTTKSLFFVDWKIDNTNIYKAFCLAEYAHRGVTRKMRDVPFIAHSYEVASITNRFLYWVDSIEVEVKNNMIAAAILHDVVEDTDYDIEDIELLYGKEIRELVEQETEDKRIDKAPKETWRIRKEEFLNKLSESTYYSRVITLADKLSNMRDLKIEYKELGETLWEKFNNKNKNDHKWYYSCIVKELGKEIDLNKSDIPQLKDTQEYKELCELVENVFE